MLSILESTGYGGVIGRSLVSAALPIPGSGVVLAPVGSLAGEVVDRFAPNVTDRFIPSGLQDAKHIYLAGGDSNTKLNFVDQMRARTKYARAAKELGYNKVGQSIAAIDPGVVSILPKIIIKNSNEDKINYAPRN